MANKYHELGEFFLLTFNMVKMWDHRVVDEWFTLSSVKGLWLAQVDSCKTGFSDVLWISHVGGVIIGVCVNLLNGQGGMIQETIEDI